MAAAPARLSLTAVRRVAVFRALMLGDMLCATPALRALKAACPRAELTLIGLPWAAELAQRLPSVDHFLPFPGLPGLPEAQPDTAALHDFVSEMRARPFDLLLQLHGSGRVVNPFVAELGARCTAGFHEAHSTAPSGPSRQLYTPWPESGHEIDRLLRLTTYLGIPFEDRRMELRVQDADRERLTHVWPGWGHERYVCIHPGAQFATRRWPVDRFAAVAERLAARGYMVVVTGGHDEGRLAETMSTTMHKPSVNLAGRTTLGMLAALVARASLVVCNDTGISQLAAALRTPSVVVSCGSDVARWAPLDTNLHHTIAQNVVCRPCDLARCPFEHECATLISSHEVSAAAEGLLARTSQ